MEGGKLEIIWSNQYRKYSDILFGVGYWKKAAEVERNRISVRDRYSDGDAISRSRCQSDSGEPLGKCSRSCRASRRGKVYTI